MIELRGLVAFAGMTPLDAVVGRGEVVCVRGDRRARHALFEVLAGQRQPLEGTVTWRDGARRVLVRAGDSLPPYSSTADGLRYYAAAWGEHPAEGAGGVIDRGLAVRANAWLIADAAKELGHSAANVVAGLADELRTGSGVLIVADPAVRGDREWQLEPCGGAIGARAHSELDEAPSWPALIRLELRRAVRRPSVPLLAALGLMLAWLAWTVVPTFEEFWFERGGLGGYRIAGHAVCTLAAVCTAVFAATHSLDDPRVMAETPLGAAGYRRLQRLGGVAGVVALSAGAGMAAVWAARSGATGIGNALLFAIWPVVAGVITGAAAELLDSLRVPRTAGAVVAATSGAALGVFVGGFGLLW